MRRRKKRIHHIVKKKVGGHWRTLKNGRRRWIHTYDRRKKIRGKHMD